MKKRGAQGKTLQMIFANNPDLLNEKEVQELAMYSQEKYRLLHKRFRKLDDLMNEIGDLIAYSDAVIKGGKPSKDVLLEIWNIYGKV